MVNILLIKKWAALTLTPLFVVIGYMVGDIFYGFWAALGIMLGMLVFSALIANLMLKNPFSDMIEGKGIMVIDMNSTGVLRPFIVQVTPPYVKGRMGKEEVADIFDREAVFNLAAPKKTKSSAVYSEDGGLTISLDEETYNRGRFALFHYPCLVYNSAIKSIVTKDFLSKKEKDAFAEHGVLYLNKKVEELTSYVRDFGRGIVELIKPKQSIWANKWVIIIIIIFVLLLAAAFVPVIIKTIQGQGGISSLIPTQGSVIPNG